MYEIVKKIKLAENIYSMDILAPRIAEKAEPGQFVIVIADEKGERVPLTISDFDREQKTVQVVIQAIGPSTRRIALLEDAVHDFVGPLGNPTDLIYKSQEELEKERFLFIGGGLGTAPVYPQVKWLYERGIDVDVIIGAKSADLLIMESEMRKVSKNLYICTDDGSKGFHGLVTGKIDELYSQGKTYTHAVAIGPMIMMKFTCLTTEKYDLPTVVSLNPIMVDGTGMCGACRCTVDGKTKFACVQGPEFDGHKVDFDEAIKRQVLYKDLPQRQYFKPFEVYRG